MPHSISLVEFALFVLTIGAAIGAILTACWTHTLRGRPSAQPTMPVRLPDQGPNCRTWHDEAVHMTIIVLDIASFTHPARKSTDQLIVHNGLHVMLRQALADAGIPPAACWTEDRGDGALIMVPACYPKRWLVEQWLTLLAARLHEHNTTHRYTSEMQVRVACHAGEAHMTAHGVVSHAVNLAFELVNARAAKEALKISGSAVAFVASDGFYQDVIAQLPGAAPAEYDRIVVTGKRMETTAWLYLPDSRTHAELGITTDTSPAHLAETT